jgi:hypothetical protein
MAMTIDRVLEVIEEATSLEYEQDMSFGAEKLYDFDNGKIGIEVVHNIAVNIVTICSKGEQLMRAKLSEMNEESVVRNIKVAVMTAMLGR